MRVGFLPLYNIEGPSSRYRVFQFIPWLEARGIQCEVLPAAERHPVKRILYVPRLMHLARRCDVLFIQKRTLPKWVLQPLLQINPRIVFDLDDAVYLRPWFKAKIDLMLKASRMVIVGNQELAEYAQHVNANTIVIPSVIDTDSYRPLSTTSHPDDSRTIIGWIGINPNRGDFRFLGTVFQALAESYGNSIALRIVSDKPLEMETSLAIEFTRWTLVGSRSELQQFDIGIMPIEDNAWNRGKCGFKLIQYMAVGIAAVASPVGVNKEIIDDGVNGYLAKDNQSWQLYLSRLVDDVNLQRRIGKRARQRIEAAYSVQAVLPQLTELLHQVAAS